MQGGTLYLVHSDHLARPIRVTDAARATVWQATWGPWGDPHAISGTLALDMRFPGQLYQIETGLHYNWHRHYDPVTGRYIQPDPLRFVDGPSVYAYAGSSPYMHTDVDGRWKALADKLAKIGKKIWKDLNFDGPGAGAKHGNGRIGQVRYKKKPVIRVDFQPIPGSHGRSRLHIHCWWDMSKHYTIDWRSFFD